MKGVARELSYELSAVKEHGHILDTFVSKSKIDINTVALSGGLS
jgi:hypothetical protein